MKNSKYIFLGIVLYFIADSILLLLSKFVDILTFVFELNIILNLSSKFILYVFLIFIFFRFIKYSKFIIKPWLLILIILTRFIPSVVFTHYSNSDMYYLNSIDKFLAYSFLLVIAVISYIKQYKITKE